MWLGGQESEAVARLGWVTLARLWVPATAGLDGLPELVRPAQVEEGSAVPVRAGRVRQAGRSSGGKDRQAARLQGPGGRHVGWCLLGLLHPARLLPGHLVAPSGSRCGDCTEALGPLTSGRPRSQPTVYLEYHAHLHDGCGWDEILSCSTRSTLSMPASTWPGQRRGTHTGAPASGAGWRRALAGCGSPRWPGPGGPGGLWRIGSQGGGAGGWSAPAQRRTGGSLGPGGGSVGWGLQRGCGLQAVLCQCSQLQGWARSGGCVMCRPGSLCCFTLVRLYAKNIVFYPCRCSWRQGLVEHGGCAVVCVSQARPHCKTAAVPKGLSHGSAG